VQVQHADRVVFVADVRDAYPSIDGQAPRVGHVHRAQHAPTPRVEDADDVRLRVGCWQKATGLASRDSSR